MLLALAVMRLPRETSVLILLVKLYAMYVRTLFIFSLNDNVQCYTLQYHLWQK